MSCPGREALDACAVRELPPARAAAVEEHAGRCASCGRRLTWIRRENEAIRSSAAHAGTDIETLWGPIRSRIERKRRPCWLAPAATAAAFAAASVLLLAHLRTEDAEQTPSAAAAMTRAEQEYSTDVAVLEAQVEARHAPAGRKDSALTRTRHGLASARASAGDDPGARVRLLEGYAAYLKSLRRALQDGSP
jgi:hypothetical protein